MRVLVIGGGVAGLAAAWELLARDASARVVVVESEDRVGGKLRGERVAGVLVDVGAEAMLNRRPEGVALARAAGVDVVHPTAATSRLWSYGQLRPLPRSLMGVPMDAAALATSGALSPEGLARALAEPDLPPTTWDGDVSVGDLVDARFGAEVTDRLVEPLLGGVYAGHAREISARAAAPALLGMAAGGSMLRAAQALSDASVQPTGQVPVFAAVAGGMNRLPEALAVRLAESGRAQVRTGVEVTAVRRAAAGFVATVGAGEPLEGTWDAVVVATPARAAARLLAGPAPEAAAEVAGFEAASVGVVTLALDAARALGVLGQDRSGFLVPPVEGRRIKASTFSYAKWAQVRDAGRGAGPDGTDLLLLRTSVGRHREADVLDLPDEELVRLSLEELAAATGLGVEPVGWHVQRWREGLPQYPVGHDASVARIRAAVAQVPGLAVCGASYDGVGIPATVSSAHRAVDVVLRAQ